MKTMNFALIAAALLVAQGCATITRGTSQDYAIHSNPQGALVTLSTGQQCLTPCNLKLKRKGGFTATISKKGYETQYRTVSSDVAGMGAVGMAGNVVAGGIIGLGVDAYSGAANELTPNPLTVVLSEEETETVAKKTTQSNQG